MKKMSKKQKGFQLPLEVIEWLDTEQAKTGASLSRLALAAFVAYKCSGSVRQQDAMRLAMDVERGRAAFESIKSDGAPMMQLASSS